jgi:hypothetical protein
VITTVQAEAPVEAGHASPPLTTLLVFWSPATGRGRPESGAGWPAATPVEAEPTWEDAEWR